MKYNPQQHGRRSIRMKGYDYTQPGTYFVTICTYSRACLFDDPVLRRVVEAYWQAIPQQARHVALDVWVGHAQPPAWPPHCSGTRTSGRGKAFPASASMHATTCKQR